tara:strand:- start:245 stop:376 length:132 start_codon:yes stop_codon:yes gene_type:complete
MKQLTKEQLRIQLKEAKDLLKEVVSEGSAPPYITNKIKDLLND